METLTYLTRSHAVARRLVKHMERSFYHASLREPGSSIVVIEVHPRDIEHARRYVAAVLRSIT